MVASTDNTTHGSDDEFNDKMQLTDFKRLYFLPGKGERC